MAKLQYALVFTMTALLAACSGSNSATTNYSYYAYVANNGDNTLSGFVENVSTGALTPIATYNLGTAPISVVGDAAGGFVYVASTTTISSFSINPSTGVLTAISGSPFTLPGSLKAFPSIDPSGNYIYLPTSVGIAVIAATNGSLSQVTGSPFSLGLTGSISGTTAIAPNGKSLYLVTQSPDQVYHITIGSGGSLSSPTASSVGSSSNGVAVDPTSSVLYVASAGGPSSPGIAEFLVNSSNGALTSAGSFVSTTPYTTLAIHPTSKYLYASSPTSSTISAFSINLTTAALSAIGSPATAVGQPSVSTIDPLGQFLYSDNGMMGATAFSAYSIASTGALSALTGTFGAGKTPSQIYVAKVPQN
jgi:6-phosphogluconolactonase